MLDASADGEHTQTEPMDLEQATTPTLAPAPTPVSSSSTSTPTHSEVAGGSVTSFHVEEDGLGIKGYLSMRDEGVTYHRMRRYYCRCVGVNFLRFSSRETASALINAVFGAEIERVEPWDGRGLLHTYRNSFKLYFTNGVVFNVDADSEEDKKAWIEYIENAIRGVTAALQHWTAHADMKPELLTLSPGGLALADKKTAGSTPKFKNLPNCSHPTCGARFDSTSKRQHHCRNCGSSVCSDHSYRFALLRHYQMNDAVRLCTNCYRVQRFITWLNMLVQRLSIARVAPVKPRFLTPSEQEDVDAVVRLLDDDQFGVSDVIQVLHLQRQAPDEAYIHAVNKLMELSASNLTDFEFFLPQIFHMWLTMDWTANNMKAAMLFRVVSYAAQLHVRFATSLYWLARAAVDDSCGWGFGQSELYIPEYLYRKLSLCKMLMINLEMQIYRDQWEFQPDQDIPASELQTSMIRCLFDRLNVLLQQQVGRHSILYGPICEAASLLALPTEYLEGDDFGEDEPAADLVSENRDIFQTQIKFIQELCDMTERLRKVSPEQRKRALKQELAVIKMPENAFCPLGSCEDALLRFLTIARDEGAVFTTRARAPTLVFFEVEQMSSFSQNPWLQRIDNPYNSSGDFSHEGDEGVVHINDQSGLASHLQGGLKNAIEMATSSAIAQAIPASAYKVDDPDDRISEAFKAAGHKGENSANGLKYPTLEEDDECALDDDNDDEETREERDRVASNPAAVFPPPMSRENSSNRRRSGSLMTMTTKSFDSLLAAYDTFSGHRKRSMSEGTEKDFEAKTSTLRNEVESFTIDQMMTMAQNLEISMLAENPGGKGIFTGEDVTRWMTQNEIVTDQNHALWLGTELVRSGVLVRLDGNVETPLSFAGNETMYRLRPEMSTQSQSKMNPEGSSSPSSAASTPRPKRSSSSPAVPSAASPSPRTVSFTPTSRKPPTRSSSAMPTGSSRIISPRRRHEIDRTDIADAVGATYASSPRFDVSRSSQNRDSSLLSSGNDEQRSVMSNSQLSNAAFEKIQPDVALSALETIDAALEAHVFSQPAIEDGEHIRQQLRVLKEQVEAVAEYIGDKKKKRHIAVESAFGESFEEKRERLRKSSRYLKLSRSAEWDCVAFIVKSNDDLRQEVLCLQLIRQLQDIFQAAELPLRLLPYRIIATSASTGMIEYVKNATSLDSLKKRPGYTTLANHFVKTYGDPESETYKAAMANYVRSMAAYSLACYFLQIKDRHNGNIMIDSDGHVVHIDYGFILGIAPGGRFSLETAPFKLTAEMVDAMGGTQSEYFKAYVILLIQGFLALQQHADTVLLMIAIMAQESSCPCFLSQNPRDVLNATKSLFKLHYNQSQVIKYVLRLVRRSHNSYRTRQYDVFQKLTNGILP